MDAMEDVDGFDPNYQVKPGASKASSFDRNKLTPEENEWFISLGAVVEENNVVCTFDVGMLINMLLFATFFKARYDKIIFPACVLHLLETITSAQVFRSGKVVLVGCKSEGHALHAAHLFVMSLWKMMGVHGNVYNLAVCNCVCRLSMRFKINLDLFFDDAASGKIDKVVQTNDKGIGGPQLDPERFPGMAFSILDQDSDQRITVAMFDSGNGVGTGIKEKYQVEALKVFLNEVLPRYRIGREYREMDPLHARSVKRTKIQVVRKNKKKKVD